MVLYLDKITNHPSYSPGTQEDIGANLKGPYAGGDIAVYHLKGESKQKLKAAMEKKKLSDFPKNIGKVSIFVLFC